MSLYPLAQLFFLLGVLTDVSVDYGLKELAASLATLTVPDGMIGRTGLRT